MTRRFVVRELEGFRVTASAAAHYGKRKVPGLTVWVADEALGGKEIRVWRSEDMGHHGRVWAREVCRRNAKKVARRLNAEDRMRV